MKTVEQTLIGKGYRLLVGATPEPSEIWQGPDGRRVLRVGERIYSRADLVERLHLCESEESREYYNAVLRNWG